jgi:hypothetical protein
VNLDDLDQDRPDLNCEPLQAPGTARNLNWTRQNEVSCPGWAAPRFPDC